MIHLRPLCVYVGDLAAIILQRCGAMDQPGQPQIIPLADLDLNATLGANHDRGVNLRVPANPNEVVMGF